jgi:hypothetical protein
LQALHCSSKIWLILPLALNFSCLVQPLDEGLHGFGPEVLAGV